MLTWIQYFGVQSGKGGTFDTFTVCDEEVAAREVAYKFVEVHLYVERVGVLGFCCFQRRIEDGPREG